MHHRILLFKGTGLSAATAAAVPLTSSPVSALIADPQARRVKANKSGVFWGETWRSGLWCFAGAVVEKAQFKQCLSLN